MQKRRIETRARLKSAATDIVAAGGYASLRVEEVVLRAGVAKGTFFAHFPDKDALLAELIGDEMNRTLAEIEAGPAPANAAEISAALDPLLQVMASEREVFDIVLRYSGATGAEDETEIARNFLHQFTVTTRWIAALQGRGLRRDIGAELLAEGVQAFMIQAIALKFCVMHEATTVQDRLRRYLAAWLEPSATA